MGNLDKTRRIPILTPRQINGPAEYELDVESGNFISGHVRSLNGGRVYLLRGLVQAGDPLNDTSLPLSGNLWISGLEECQVEEVDPDPDYNSPAGDGNGTGFGWLVQSNGCKLVIDCAGPILVEAWVLGSVS